MRLLWICVTAAKVFNKPSYYNNAACHQHSSLYLCTVSQIWITTEPIYVILCNETHAAILGYYTDIYVHVLICWTVQLSKKIQAELKTNKKKKSNSWSNKYTEKMFFFPNFIWWQYTRTSWARRPSLAVRTHCEEKEGKLVPEQIWFDNNKTCWQYELTLECKLKTTNDAFRLDSFNITLDNSNFFFPRENISVRNSNISRLLVELLHTQKEQTKIHMLHQSCTIK